MLWKMIGAAICWLIAYYFINRGLKLTEEAHKKKSFADYAPSVGGSTTIVGFIIEMIFGLLIGVILKALPWWMAKAVFLLIGLGLVILGFMCILWKTS